MKDAIRNEIKQHETEKISEQEEQQLLEHIQDMVRYLFLWIFILIVLGVVSYYFG